MTNRHDYPNDVAFKIIELMEQEPGRWMEITQKLLNDHYHDLTDVLREMCRRPELYEMKDGKDNAFKIRASLMKTEGELVLMMAEWVFSTLHTNHCKGGDLHSRHMANQTLTWLLEHKELATRSDLAGGPYGRNVIESLVWMWNEDVSIGRSVEHSASREWVGEAIHTMMKRGATLDRLSMKMDLLAWAGRSGSGAINHNPGLFLALLDNGARWEATLIDPMVTASYKDMVRTHPAFMREQLQAVAKDITMPKPARRRDM